MSLDDLATFVHAVDAGSVSGAARALRVPKSTVSRRLQRLEEVMGLTLLHRNAHSFRLTDAGRDLYDRAAPACRDLDEATRLVRDGATSPAGRLRVTAPVDVGSGPALVQVLCGFRRRYPDVSLEVILTDRLVDLGGEGVDFAFRAHRGQLAGRATLVAKRVMALEAGLYATPAYLASFGRPAHPTELAHHELYVPTFGDESRPLAMTPPGQGGPPVVLRSLITTSSLTFVRSAVVNGGGIGVIPTFDGGLLASQGRLERLFGDWRLPTGQLSLLWPANRQMAPRARAFVDYAVACLEPTPG